jgi:hypothetical protein
MEVLDLLAAAPPTSESAEASKPSIEILGIHLTGAAAWAAFVVSLVSVAQAVFAAISWIRRKLIPISLEAWAWDATTDPGNRPATQLRIDVYNNTDQEKHLMRLQAVYDPGRWKRRVPGWHLRTLTQPETVDFRENDFKLSYGGNQIYAVAIHQSSGHRQLIVIAGFSRKRVRTATAERRSTPIKVPGTAATGGTA